MWNDETNGEENEIDNSRINNNKTIRSKSIKYKIKIMGSTPNNNNILDVEIVIPIKYYRSFNLPLINCSKKCVISEISKISKAGVHPPVQQVATHKQLEQRFK